jgi:hypothetical protein
MSASANLSSRGDAANASAPERDTEPAADGGSAGRSPSPSGGEKPAREAAKAKPKAETVRYAEHDAADLLDRIASAPLFASAPQDLIEARRVEPTPTRFAAERSAEALAKDPETTVHDPEAAAKWEARRVKDQAREAALKAASIDPINGRLRFDNTLAHRGVEGLVATAKAAAWRLFSPVAWAARGAGLLVGLVSPGAVPEPFSGIGFALAQLPHQDGAFAGHLGALAWPALGGVEHAFVAGVVIYALAWILSALPKGFAPEALRQGNPKVRRIAGAAANALEGLAWFAVFATLRGALGG